MADEVTGLQTDSRRVEEGDLFVAVGGGAAFVEDALARGAAAALVPARRVRGARRTRRPRPRTQLGALRRDHRVDGQDLDEGHPRRGLWCPQRRTVAAERSYNAEIGVPLTIGRVEPDTELCILELAMRGFGQIAELCAFARPHLGVVTNVGPVHLEKVGDLGGVVRAKSELIEALPPGGTAVVPAGFPVERDDLQVVSDRRGRDARIASSRLCWSRLWVRSRSISPRATSPSTR